MIISTHKFVNLKEGKFEINKIAVNIPEEFYKEDDTDCNFIATCINCDNLKDYKIEFETAMAETLKNASTSQWFTYKVIRLFNEAA